MPESITLWGLFASSFVSSTLFPGGSELVLGALALDGEYDPWLLLAVATLGNTLGAMTTWLLGWLVARRLPVEGHLKADRRRALERLRRFGTPALLLSWLPVVGDPLCFAAGYLRLPLAASAVFIALGKALRYGAILLAVG
ncbi:MAG: DedA family protein [Comamonadaceae bacterium]|nr:DedA family protein [Comamonadaceae bacterium]